MNEEESLVKIICKYKSIPKAPSYRNVNHYGRKWVFCDNCTDTLFKFSHKGFYFTPEGEPRVKSGIYQQLVYKNYPFIGFNVICCCKCYTPVVFSAGLVAIFNISHVEFLLEKDRNVEEGYILYLGLNVLIADELKVILNKILPDFPVGLI